MKIGAMNHPAQNPVKEIKWFGQNGFDFVDLTLEPPAADPADLDIQRVCEALARQGLGVVAERRRGYPGLWVGPRKIASVGVRVSRFVTHHGMAINIRNDLSLFEMMVPCGLDGVEMTSVQKETGRTFEMGPVKSRLTTLLKHHFSTGQR